MIKTFETKDFDHHITINDNGRTLLIDTGSPSTLFDGDAFEFLGKRVSKGIRKGPRIRQLRSSGPQL